MKANPRRIRVDGIEIVLTGCGDCPVRHEYDESGDYSCRHPLTNRDIEEELASEYEWFPNWCCLKEVR